MAKPDSAFSISTDRGKYHEISRTMILVIYSVLMSCKLLMLNSFNFEKLSVAPVSS